MRDHSVCESVCRMGGGVALPVLHSLQGKMDPAWALDRTQNRLGPCDGVGWGWNKSHTSRVGT